MRDNKIESQYVKNIINSKDIIIQDPGADSKRKLSGDILNEKENQSIKPCGQIGEPI